jgi:hypothetical protein
MPVCYYPVTLRRRMALAAVSHSGHAAQLKLILISGYRSVVFSLVNHSHRTLAA